MWFWSKCRGWKVRISDTVTVYLIMDLELTQRNWNILFIYLCYSGINTDQHHSSVLMLVCQKTTKTQIELRKGIYLMPRLKIQGKCKNENNDENTRKIMIKSQYLKVNWHLTNLVEKKKKRRTSWHMWASGVPHEWERVIKVKQNWATLLIPRSGICVWRQWAKHGYALVNNMHILRKLKTSQFQN